jgi:hypothetical protein
MFRLSRLAQLAVAAAFLAAASLPSAPVFAQEKQPAVSGKPAANPAAEKVGQGAVKPSTDKQTADKLKAEKAKTEKAKVEKAKADKTKAAPAQTDTTVKAKKS